MGLRQRDPVCFDAPSLVELEKEFGRKDALMGFKEEAERLAVMARLVRREDALISADTAAIVAALLLLLRRVKNAGAGRDDED